MRVPGSLAQPAAASTVEWAPLFKQHAGGDSSVCERKSLCPATSVSSRAKLASHDVDANR